MYIVLSFAERENLKPGDVVVVPKSQFNIIAHYAVYWGKHNGIHYYLENNDKVGVKYIDEATFMRENPTYKRLRRMGDSQMARIAAIKRAEALVGSPYNLENFNCEHYANHVQYGTSFSKQVNEIKAGLTAAAAVVGIFALLSAIFE